MSRVSRKFFIVIWLTCFADVCICAGPQLDWDPDVVAGLDVDFDYDNPDNVLEDDFVTIAEGPVPQNIEDGMDQEFE